jgi:hypothetical protein
LVRFDVDVTLIVALVTVVRFDIPYTFNVDSPYTIAVFTVKYSTFKDAIFAVAAERFPESVVLDDTLRTCVLIYGIVNVSKKNVAFVELAVIEPVTFKVSFTYTFVVDTELDTYTFPVTSRLDVASVGEPILTFGT